MTGGGAYLISGGLNGAWISQSDLSDGQKLVVSIFSVLGSVIGFAVGGALGGFGAIAGSAIGGGLVGFLASAALGGNIYDNGNALVSGLIGGAGGGMFAQLTVLAMIHWARALVINALVSGFLEAAILISPPLIPYPEQ